MFHNVLAVRTKRTSSKLTVREKLVTGEWSRTVNPQIHRPGYSNGMCTINISMGAGAVIKACFITQFQRGLGKGKNCLYASRRTGV